MKTTVAHYKISEIGNFTLYRKTEQIIENWNKPGAGRFDTPREKFYLDGITFELQSKTTGFIVSERRPGAHPVIWEYSDVAVFNADQGINAINQFRKCVNEGRA
jgi:hypothetical protein